MTEAELVALARAVEEAAAGLPDQALVAPDGQLVPGLFEFAGRIAKALKSAETAVSVNEIRRGKEPTRKKSRVEAAQALLAARRR